MQIEPLGKLARTHTCGALRAQDVGQDVVLIGWVHRVRDLGSLVFIDLRDRYGVTQIVARDDDALLADAKRLRSEFVVAVRGRVEDRAKETVNPKIATGEIEVSAAEIRLLNEAKTPPFMIADEIEISEETRLKYRYIDLRRPRMQRNLVMRHRATMAIRQVLRRAGVSRDRNAHADQVHAGRGARLPRAEPRASRRVLCLAAVAAALQADPDDRRHGPVLSDRQVLPRRGPARRSPAGIHAGRPRDLVRDRGPRLRDARAVDGAADGPHRQGRAAAVPAAAVRGGDREIRIRQTGPAVRHGDRGSLRRLRRHGVHALPRRRRGRRRGAGLRRPGRREVFAPRARRAGRSGEAVRR